MSHWTPYSDRWNEITAPLRPNADVVAFLQARVAPLPGGVLLLGVTPELANAFPVVDGFDLDAGMIARVWPGDGPGKRARQGDWLKLPAPDEPYGAAIGDGSVSAVPAHNIAPLMERVSSLLVPGGTFACRVFERPREPFTRDFLIRSTRGKAPVNFHAFKFQVAMTLAHERGASVPVSTIRDEFNSLFPDRGVLSQNTGWDLRTIGMIDLYEGSRVVYAFPSRDELRAALPERAIDVRFDNPGHYDLVECCPVLSFNIRG